ncbi:DUF922 domain-containing protein [Pseudomonas aeruginosa]
MAEFDSFRRGPSAMLLVMAVGLAPATVLADPTGEPVVNFKVEHYWVTGRSVQEIQASISENAPTRNGDTFYAGATVWNLDSSYDYVPLASGGCAISNPRVTVNITISLPALRDDVQRSPGVIREWNRFYIALRAHELLHAANGKRTAQTLLSRLSGVRTELPCERLSVVVSQAGQALIKKLGEYDSQLDQQTNHGATQGALLDLRVR